MAHLFGTCGMYVKVHRQSCLEPCIALAFRQTGRLTASPWPRSASNPGLRKAYRVNARRATTGMASGLVAMHPWCERLQARPPERRRRPKKASDALAPDQRPGSRACVLAHHRSPVDNLAAWRTVEACLVVGARRVVQYFVGCAQRLSSRLYRGLASLNSTQ